MDDKRVREIIREEIALAMEALAGAALSTDDLHSAAGTYFTGEYGRACEQADAKRAEDAANPFTKSTPDDDDAVKKLVRAEVTDVLKHLRDEAYLSGTTASVQIGERLDSVIADRETHDPDE